MATDKNIMEGLEFLNNASNGDLLNLCDTILKGKQKDNAPNDSYRLTETLSVKEIYKTNYPDNIKAFLPELVGEFRCFGGNTIMNLFRGGNGPSYSEILRDVAKRNKVSFNSRATDEMVEQYLLQKLFDDTIMSASDDELKKMLEELGMPVTQFWREAAIAALMVAWKCGGFQSYILLVSVVNAMVRFFIGRGLSLAANAGLTRMASIFMGPVGIALTRLWTIVDIAGPAYRVTVPAVIQIAYLRRSSRIDPKLLLEGKA